MQEYKYNDDTYITNFLCKNAKKVIQNANKLDYKDRTLKQTIF